ncbi:MAG: SPOR domain-containing protein [Burkholderiales bacterium]
MRLVFLLLVLANLAFFAWSTLLHDADRGSDQKPLRAQIEPDRIRVLPATGMAAATAPKPQAPQPAVAAPAPAAAPAAAPTQAVAACIEWGSFTLTAAPAAEAALAPLALGTRLARRQVEETANWWVYMPPQGNRQNAQKKGAELKALGVEEWFIVADEGRWRWAVSLGVFRTEESARKYLDALQARGVRSALVGARETQVPKVWLQARGVDPAQLARWREIALAWPGVELRDCAA